MLTWGMGRMREERRIVSANSRYRFQVRLYCDYMERGRDFTRASFTRTFVNNGD